MEVFPQRTAPMKKKTYPLSYAGKKQPYARSVVVGDLVFISGMTGRNSETGEISSRDLAGQMQTALDKIRAALTEAGTSVDNLVKLTYFLKKAADSAEMQKLEIAYWQKYAPRLLEEPPARTLVQVLSIVHPDLLIEIEAIAVIPR
jgi:2-iminobutanoate/2-iminopropanoate deaminase